MNNLSQEDIIKMMQAFETPLWAENSQFYSQVMEDGNIFNPYIHRRFLPAHFVKLLKQAGLWFDCPSTPEAFVAPMHTVFSMQLFSAEAVRECKKRSKSFAVLGEKRCSSL